MRSVFEHVEMTEHAETVDEVVSAGSTSAKRNCERGGDDEVALDFWENSDTWRE